MCDIESTRNQLDQKLALQGYVHPETPTQNVSLYKTIDVKNESAIYESNKKHINPYKFFNSTESTKPNKNVQRTNRCPTCEEDAQFICSCEEYGDMLCKNNHYWWVNKKGLIVLGDPHDDEE